MNILLLIDSLEKFYSIWGYPFVFATILFETTPLGWTIPGGTILALGGFFAYGNNLSFVGVVISGWLGMLTTFILAYLLGKKSGYFLINFFKQQKNANKAKLLLERHGPIILTTSLLANLTRFWVAYVAGVEKYNFLKFILYSAVASLTWSSLLTTIGYFAGSERDVLEKGLASLGILSWLTVFLAFGILYYFINKEFRKSENEKNKS